MSCFQPEMERRPPELDYNSAGVSHAKAPQELYACREGVAILRRHLIDRVPVLSLLRRLVIGERIEVVDEKTVAYRELAAAILSTFTFVPLVEDDTSNNDNDPCRRPGAAAAPSAASMLVQPAGPHHRAYPTAPLPELDRRLGTQGPPFAAATSTSTAR